ncbi:MAG: sulfotransferase [Lysobacteraceae bacterium]
MPQLSANDSLRLFRSGNTIDALPHLAAAHSNDPSNLVVMHALASALQRIGKIEESVKIYRRAATASPDDPRILTGLARALLLTNAQAEAIPLLRRALAIQPQSLEAAGLLGKLLRESDQADAACVVLDPLVAGKTMDPGHPMHSNLVWEYARALWAADRLADSERQFNRHRQLRPQDPRSLVALGRLAVSRGDAKAASDLFRVALRLDPDDAAAWWELVHATPDALDDTSLQRIRSLAGTASHPTQRELFEDILVRHADSKGAYAEATIHAANANRLRVRAAGPSDNGYQPAIHVREIDTLIANYIPSLFSKLSGAGSPSSKPVFIIGLPRSGTTLFERMLDAHPQISGIGEQGLARRALQLAMTESQADLSGVTRKALTGAATWHLQELDRRERLMAPDAHAARIVDKLPDNYLLAGWLALSLPHATIIHCQRDPRDVALSCWLGRFAEIPWSHDIEHIVARIEQHRRLIRHWREVLPRRPVEVVYEDLVTRPEEVLGGTLKAMGLEWDDAVLEFTSGNGAVKSASQMQVRQPLNRKGIGRWQNYTDVLAPVMSRLDKIIADDANEGTAPRFS